MPNLKSRSAFLCVLALIACAPAAHAQWAVVDVGAIAQLIQQVQTLRQQLETARNQLSQAQQEFQSMTGNRGMERLLAGTVRNYLPPDWAALERALAEEIEAVINASAVLTPQQMARLSSAEREQLEAARRSAAMLQVTTREALQATSGRFDSLEQLINAIGSAQDQKAVLDLQARISAEQAMLQNEQTKLVLLFHAAQAEEWARRQRTREHAIASIGSLRRLPPIRLNN